MKKQLEKYFGCKVKIAEYKNKLPLPIFMTMRDIMIVEIYGVNFAIIAKCCCNEKAESKV